MSNVKVTLYHADWCGHCQKFKPQWGEFKEMAKHDGINFAEFEEQELDPNKPVMIGGVPMRGYPSIKVEYKKNGRTLDIEYNGQRNAMALLSFAKELIN